MHLQRFRWWYWLVALILDILFALFSPFPWPLRVLRTVLLLLKSFHHCCPVLAWLLGYPSVLVLLFRLSSCISLVSLAVSLFLRLRNRFYSSLPKLFRRLSRQSLNIILSDLTQMHYWVSNWAKVNTTRGRTATVGNKKLWSSVKYGKVANWLRLVPRILKRLISLYNSLVRDVELINYHWDANDCNWCISAFLIRSFLEEYQIVTGHT